MIGFIFATFSSVFLMMAVNEVGKADNVPILLTWIGNASFFPTGMFVISAILMFSGFLTWLYSVFEPQNRLLNVNLWISFAVLLVVGVCVTCWWLLNLVSSIFLSLAHGEKTVQDGRGKYLRTQSISTSEIRKHLERYVKDVVRIENMSLDILKTRLRVIGETTYLLIVCPSHTSHAKTLVTLEHRPG